MRKNKYFTKQETYSIIHSSLIRKKESFMHTIIHSLIDTLKLIPILFVSFIVMEVIEHKFSNKKKLKKINKFGPLAGATLGMIPQCGFSVIASTFYSARVITLGTLFSIYLSTSDEMLPLLIANKTDINVIAKLLFTKFILGLFFGVLVDLIYKNKIKNNVEEFCEKDNCHCEEGIIKSSIVHTLKISLFIMIINIILNFIIDKEVLITFVSDSKIISPILTSLIGLIPNCASSIAITELYLNNIISFGSCISGLLASSGIGLLILFKENKNLKENIIILLLLVLFSTICGIIINFI